MAFKKYSRKSFRKGTKRTYKRKSYAKKTPALKKIIRREIARNVENKTIQMFDFGRVLRQDNDGNFDSTNVFPLGPDPGSILINQGTGQGGRIGNRIRTKKLTLKGVFTPMPYDQFYNASPQPQQVKIVIFYDKTDANAMPAPATAADFFQNGNSARGFNGDITDMVMPVNADRYRVLLTKRFKLGWSQQPTGSSGSNPNMGQYSNNDYKMSCEFSLDLTKHYPKDVRFPDNSSLPTSRGLYCMVLVAPGDGAIAGGSISRCVNMQYCQDYHYEDA